MRITLTGRRLALAAVLVVAGATAPLAYAVTRGNDSALNRGPNARSPMQVQTVQATRTTAATADNPIQSVIHLSTTGSSGCTNLGFFPNETFVVTRVAFMTIFGSASRATVAPLVKDQNGADASDFFAFDIPLDADSDGDRAFDFLVRANQLANAANGDIYGVQLCFFNANPGNILDFVWILTGQKTGAPTAAQVSSFDATSGRAGATLQWKTASETTILGFNVWRYRGAKGVKVNRTLVRAKRSGEPKGASYRYVDQVPGAKRGLTYRLQLVDLKGKRTWYAAFAIASK